MRTGRESSLSTRSSGREGASSRHSEKSNNSDNTLLTPLIEDDTSDSGSDGSDDSSTAASYGGVPDEKPTGWQLVKTAVVDVILAAGVVASVASFIPGFLLLSPAIIVYVAGSITIANAPYAAFKEVRITKLHSLRSLNNKLRDDANRLGKEVEALSKEIDAIAPEAQRAGAVEEELREIADRQQVNVDRLIDLVNENEDILDQMRENLRKKIVQDIIHIVIKSDINNDQRFCKVESKMLALKIRIQLQEYGVEFDEMKFYKVMNVCPTLPRVIAIVQKLIPGLVHDDDSAASSDNDDDNEVRESFDMFRLASDKSIRMSCSLQDIPEPRRASSALMKSSSWRNTLRTSSSSFHDAPEEMSEARRATLALASFPSRRGHRRNSRRSSLIL